MPKKFVRDARRKAREEAYRSIDTEAHALRQEEETRENKAALPPYRSGQIKWRNAATLCAYLRTLLEWADEARSYVFSGNFPSYPVLEPETIAAVAALRIAVSDWVLRASKVKLSKRHNEIFFNETGQYRGGLQAVITTRVTYVGMSSIETEHDIFVVESKAEDQQGEHVATVSGTIIAVNFPKLNPVPVPEASKNYLLSKVVSRGTIPRKFEYPIPGADAKGSVSTVTVRRSDCDAFGHVNNCTAVDFFTDNIPMKTLESTVFFAIDYPSPLFPGDKCTVACSSWNLKEDSAWNGILTCDEIGPGGNTKPRTLRATFLSFVPVAEDGLTSDNAGLNAVSTSSYTPQREGDRSNQIPDAKM